MQNECEVYVDPEEDEVFFGRVSEKEKTVYLKLVKHEGSNSEDDLKLKILDECTRLSEDSAVVGNELISQETSQLSGRPSKGIMINRATDSVKQHDMTDKLNKSFLEDEVLSKAPSSSTSVEFEHNYSTPMKHKIDRSILRTPKSVVKADKDGGFLKMLSEIALVKAEAEGDKKSMSRKEDEDKENMSFVPEIKITEATPEKDTVASSPKSIKPELRRFRVIYNSPQNDNTIQYTSKSHVETFEKFEKERNLKNKFLNEDVKFSEMDKRKSVDLSFKNFTESGGQKESFSPKKEETKVQTQNAICPIDEYDGNSEVVISTKPVCDKNSASGSLKCAQRETEKKRFPEVDLQSSRPIIEGGRNPNALRFSKDAIKVVEHLKKSSADDTLNLTIPAINAEEEENSFLSPEPPSLFDETVVLGEKVEVQSHELKSCHSSPNSTRETTDVRVEAKSKLIEKERSKLTPTASKSKSRPVKHFSGGREVKNACAKRLPLEEKRSVAVEKLGGGASEPKAGSSSRIPVFGAKGSKVASAERTTPIPVPRVTPSKSPSIKIHKNSKFNHIESPINAYIHNKPTSLVLNVKPEVKKDFLTKLWKAQTTGGLKKVEEKGQKAQNSTGGTGVRLPFVEYKSTTAYKIEKLPESRLPRLTPTVLKLIGSQSPRVLKHEGRFHVNSARKPRPTENDTIVADPNEVSVLVSQPAQKSNTIR